MKQTSIPLLDFISSSSTNWFFVVLFLADLLSRTHEYGLNSAKSREPIPLGGDATPIGQVEYARKSRNIYGAKARNEVTVSTAIQSKKKSRTKKRKYCKSCWRPEAHVRLRFNPLIEVLLVVCTIGLIFVFWPYRCTLCGKMRPDQSITSEKRR